MEAQPAAPSAANRRREERIPFTGEIRFYPGDTINGSEGRRATLVNCSVHGLGMNSDEPMLLGSGFVISSKIGVPMIYKVRCCFETNFGYFIGAETDQALATDAKAVATQIVSEN